MAKARTGTKGIRPPKLKAQKVTKATFKYVFDQGYNPVYANGAYGGATPHGELAINFFLERHPVPFEETFSVTPDGRVGESVGREPKIPDDEVTLIRYISTGIVLNLKTARSIYEFLGRQLQQLEAQEAARLVVEKTQRK